MVLDLHQLDVIEEKLAIGFPLSVEEDIEPVKYLVASFRKIWQWYNEYPEFNSKLHVTLFRTVFYDMFPKFGSSNSDIMLFENDKRDSNLLSNEYETDLKTASDDVCRSNSNVPFEDDGRNSESTSNVDNKNSEENSVGVCRANVDPGSMSNNQSPIPIFHLECGMCDRKFPLLNNDSAYAYQMHAQTPEHIEAVDLLEILHSVSIDTASTSNIDVENASAVSCKEIDSVSNVSSDTLQSVVTNAPALEDITERNLSSSVATNDYQARRSEFLYGCTSNVRQRVRHRKEQQSQKEPSTSMSEKNNSCKEDKWIQKKGNGKYCILCDANLPGASQVRTHMNGQMHQQDSPLVEIHFGNKYSCTLCHTSELSLDKLHEHLNGKKHNQKAQNRERQSKQGSNASLSSNSMNFFDIFILSPENIYRANCETRMAYFLNKSCIVSSRFLGEMVTSCLLCDFGYIDESHLLESTHRSKVAEVIKKSNPRTATFDFGIVNRSRGKKGTRCHFCGINLPKNNPQCYFVHLTSRFHTERLQEYFSSSLSRYKDWEKGIFLREGKPYCAFCKLILPTEKSMLEHLADPAHMKYIVTNE